MSRRLEILDAVMEALAGVEGLSLSRAMRHVEEVEEFPFAALRFAGEEKRLAATAGPSGKQARIEIGVAAYVRSETPLEDMLALFDRMERAVEADPGLGKPWPCMARFEAFEIVNTSRAASEDAVERFGAGEALLTVEYRHERANP
jgi:hypothetical protein